jgi:hypothetical protein
MSHLHGEGFSLNYSQSQHQEVVCASAGSSLLWLKDQFQKTHPELVENFSGESLLRVEVISLEVLKEFGLESFFNVTDKGVLNLKIASLPEYLRIPDGDGAMPIKIDLRLSSHALLGLRKLIKEGGTTEPFKNFAIGLLIQDDRFDAFVCRGQKYSMPLGEVFNYVVFALGSMESDLAIGKASARALHERPSGVFGVSMSFSASGSQGFGGVSSPSLKPFLGWKVLYDRMMDGAFFLCPTARRHELVAVLGEMRCPGIYVFHHPIKFLDQCVDEFLNQKSQAFYESNSAGYLTWMSRFFLNKTMGGALKDLFAGAVSGQGETLGAGSFEGAAFLQGTRERGSDLDKIIEELRRFLLEQFRRVGLIQRTTLTPSAGEAYALGEMLLKAISDRFPEDNLTTSLDYLESRPLPKLFEKNFFLAFERIQYLQEKHPLSGAARWVRVQMESGRQDVLGLGDLASQFSEDLETLGMIEKYRLIGEERLLVQRERARLSFLRLEDPVLFEEALNERQRVTMIPAKSADVLWDRVHVQKLIRERSSGRSVFVREFFANWKAAWEAEDPFYAEQAQNRLIGDFLSGEEWMPLHLIEEYVQSNTTCEEIDGARTLFLDLEVQTVNAILMQALKRPYEERMTDALALKKGEELSPFFKALVQVMDFIKQSFSGKENELALKKDSYPDFLLDLILSGGGIEALVFQKVNLVNFSRKIKFFQDNRWDCLANFPISREGQLWLSKKMDPELALRLIKKSFGRSLGVFSGISFGTSLTASVLRPSLEIGEARANAGAGEVPRSPRDSL